MRISYSDGYSTDQEKFEKRAKKGFSCSLDTVMDIAQEEKIRGKVKKRVSVAD